jgi:hypothetical protein
LQFGITKVLGAKWVQNPRLLLLYRTSLHTHFPVFTQLDCTQEFLRSHLLAVKILFCGNKSVNSEEGKLVVSPF